MKFVFNVNMTDKDYLDYNVFWMTRSAYGKGQLWGLRIFLVIAGIIPLGMRLWHSGFSVESVLGIIPIAVVLILAQLLLAPLFKLFLRGQLKALKKSGKTGYSPESIMEFSDDGFCEITPTSRTEQKYDAVERVSVIEGGAIYIHVNNVMAYVLTSECLGDRREDFLAFIKTKCDTVDVYSAK